MPDMDEIIQEMVRRIVEVAHPDRIILFGSRARGAATADSDVDLLVVAPSTEPPWQRVVPLYRALRGLGVSKDILWHTPEEVAHWQDALSHVIAVALREGKVLYGSQA